MPAALSRKAKKPERRLRMNPGNHEKFTQQSFDSYCKRVAKITALKCYDEIKQYREREVTLSAMSKKELISLITTDKYFTDEYSFSILGKNIGVSDYDLAEALSGLPADRRDIILMSYFFEMTDREIAEKLNMARRTVAYRRTSSLKELKNLLESEE